MFWNFLLIPLVIYAGFGRVVMLYERKSSLLQVAQAQELLLHILPLGMLVFYNKFQAFAVNAEVTLRLNFEMTN